MTSGPIKHIPAARGGGVLASAYHLLKFNKDSFSRLVIEDRNGEVRVRHLGHVGVLEKLHLAYLLGKSRVFKPVRDLLKQRSVSNAQWHRVLLCGSGNSAMVLAQVYGHMYTLHYTASRQLPQLERQQKIRSMRWDGQRVMAAGLVILLSFWRI